jgi:uncharacterized protein
MSGKKTLVFGATPNPERYAYQAAIRLKSKGYDVILYGLKKGEIGGMEILNTPPQLEDVDTVTLYIRPELQKPYYDYIVSLKPKRIIFNPGTENFELIKLAKEKNIAVEIGCTLVMLTVGTY